MLAKLSRADMMARMPGNARGVATRRAILAALLKSQPQTVSGLAAAINRKVANIREHVDNMESDGLLTVTRRLGRHGSEVSLTTAGEEAAKLL